MAWLNVGYRFARRYGPRIARRYGPTAFKYARRYAPRFARWGYRGYRAYQGYGYAKRFARRYY